MRNRFVIIIAVLICASSILFSGCAKKKTPSVEDILKEVEVSTASEDAQGVDPEYMREVSNLNLKIKKNPKDTKSMIELGNLYIDNFEYIKAIAVYVEALKYDKNNVSVISDVGAAYYRLGNTDEALKYFEQAVELKPDHAQAWYNIGVINHIKENRKETIAAWEEFLALETDKSLTDPIKLEVDRLKKGEPFKKPTDDTSDTGNTSGGDGSIPMPNSGTGGM